MQFTLVKKVMNSRIRFPFNTFFLNPVYVASRSLRSNYKKALPKYVQQKQCFPPTQSPSERKYASSYPVNLETCNVDVTIFFSHVRSVIIISLSFLPQIMRKIACFTVKRSFSHLNSMSKDDRRCHLCT